MAITGVRSVGAQSKVPLSLERIVEASVDLLSLFDLVEDVDELRDSLVREYRRLTLLGPGRLFVALPASVPTSLMVTILNEIAIDQGVDGARGDVALLDAVEVGVPQLPTARLALHAQTDVSPTDSLLHYTQWPLDRTPRSLSSQRILFDGDRDYLERLTPGAAVYAATLRDSIVWALLDLLQGVPVDRLPLGGQTMHLLSHHAPVGVTHEAETLLHVRHTDGVADSRCGVGVTIGHCD